MTLHDNKLISVKKMLLAGIATILLASIVLTNPFTEKLFYFDVSAGYVEGPWYRLMYYSAFFHLAVILILVISWRKEFGPQKTKVILDILILCGCGVVIQLLHYSLLMTGFGMSLGILALFLTINNPNANRDSLTGVYNHLYLTRRSDELIAAGKSFHIITIYLYQLKHINKVAGVEGGDYILQLTAKKLEELCGSRVFRITGKRFLVLTMSLQECEYYITQIKKRFETDMQLDADSSKPATPVILSGIVHGQKLGTSGLMLEYAEYLESLSMQNGMIEVIQDDQQTMDGFLYNKKVEQYLHTAIAQDLFEVYYQPVYSTAKNDFVTLEALSRLHHPELGWIAPDVFIQIAEKNHMIEQITDLQFKRICMFINEHRDLMKKLFNIKVNLSSLDLMRSDCSSHFIHMMDDMDIHHDWIQFEITETVATEYNAGLGMVIDGFMAAGVRLCLDDFGSGYANLNTVMRLPFSAIKIDRTLLFDICNDKKRAMFYQSIVETFRRMGYSIVSEGVETEEEMSLLSRWGVDMIQGYYFSRPLPVDELLKLLNM